MKLLILGIDGFDSNIIEKLWEKDKLPNLKKLKTNWSFRKLITTNPPQSPVVWATIATGTNPGQHGIFDFITVDFDTYLPKLSIIKPNKNNIFGLRAKLFSNTISTNPYWYYTSKAKIPTSTTKWPVTFPPPKVWGTSISGLGVPDINNTLGRYTFLTTDANYKNQDLKGEVIKIDKSGKNIINLKGPAGTNCSIQLYNSSLDNIEITTGKQRQKLVKDLWTQWINLKFANKSGRIFYGICKFLLLNTKPNLEIYISSIHLNPKNPLAPITYPDDYSEKLTNKLGLFHTLGMPEESNGLQDDIISEDNFLNYVDNIQKEREELFWFEFNKFKDGLYSFVFDSLDRIQHMFWYTKDLTHPIRNKLNTNKFNDILNSYYQKIDNFVGEILKSDKNLTLIIISDHGFSTYTRSVHLNTWLLNNGFLKLKNDMTVNPLHANVDWSKTVAYAGGFGGIYINTLGREKYGIVNKSDAEKLSTEIARKLKTLKDKKYNRGVFNKIYLKKEIYQGEFTNFAPDLTTGTNPGYRISWQTALGSGEKVIIEDNLKHWCGDHLIDPHFVPGVFFSNKKIVEKNPSVYDIAPTVLNFFSLPKTKEMSGKILF